jgi:hypothetical protein
LKAQLGLLAPRQVCHWAKLMHQGCAAKMGVIQIEAAPDLDPERFVDPAAMLKGI